jgi:hypothetical protein
MKNPIVLLGSTAILSLVGTLPIQATTLYDGTSGVTPNNYNAPNPYLGFTTINPSNIAGPAGSQTYDSTTQSTILNSSGSESYYSGYRNYNATVNPSNPSVILPTSLINPSFPSLDPQAGYTISFTAKMAAQTNNGANGPYRAGFSILVVSDNLKAIEIGFRNPNTQTNTPDIFSQNNSSFNSVGESNGNLGDILDNFTTYNLAIAGNQYTLFTGGTILLQGALRDYSSASGFGSAVYQTPNFLFLGDDTTSAGGTTYLQNISLTTAVPEPLNIFGAASVVALAAALKRCKR